jgi:hypothetical protein
MSTDESGSRTSAGGGLGLLAEWLAELREREVLA